MVWIVEERETYFNGVYDMDGSEESENEGDNSAAHSDGGHGEDNVVDTWAFQALATSHIAKLHSSFYYMPIFVRFSSYNNSIVFTQLSRLNYNNH